MGLEDALKKLEVELSCPACGKNFKACLEDLTKGKIKCPHCSRDIEIKLEGDDLSELFKAAQNLDNTIKKFEKL